MDNRTRILTILQGDTPDRVPWFGDLSYWGLSLNNNLVNRDYSLEDEFYKFHEELNVGFYLQGYEPYKPVYDDNISVEIIEHDNIRERKINTSVGEIKEEWIWLGDSWCEAPREYFIKTIKDVRVFKYWLEHMKYIPDYKEAEKRYQLVGNNGVVLCYLPKSPFMQLVTLLSGIENIVDLWVDHKEEFEEFLHVFRKKTNEAAEIALNSPAECLMIPENLSSEVVGKNYFKLYIEDYQKCWTKKIKERGKYSFIHMDGTLNGLISEVGQVGFTVMEALTPHPVGDLTLESIDEKTPDTTIIWGGIPGIYFTPLVKEKDFIDLTIKTIKFMREKPRYVLGVSDQVPPNGIRKRVKKVSELVDKYGYY